MIASPNFAGLQTVSSDSNYECDCLGDGCVSFACFVNMTQDYLGPVIVNVVGETDMCTTFPSVTIIVMVNGASLMMTSRYDNSAQLPVRTRAGVFTLITNVFFAKADKSMYEFSLQFISDFYFMESIIPLYQLQLFVPPNCTTELQTCTISDHSLLYTTSSTLINVFALLVGLLTCFFGKRTRCGSNTPLPQTK